MFTQEEIAKMITRRENLVNEISSLKKEQLDIEAAIKENLVEGWGKQLELKYGVHPGDKVVVTERKDYWPTRTIEHEPMFFDHLEVSRYFTGVATDSMVCMHLSKIKKDGTPSVRKERVYATNILNIEKVA